MPPTVPVSNAINPDAAQSFMQGMTNSPKPSMPIEWNQGAGQWELRDPAGSVVGNFPTYSEAADFAGKVKTQKDTQVIPSTAAVRDFKGGEVQDFREGGPVPGHAKVKGDSPVNDTVDAKLSPGEIVVPRSAANDEDEFKAFMGKFKPFHRKAATGETPKQSKVPLEARALAHLHQRVSQLEQR